MYEKPRILRPSAGCRLSWLRPCRYLQKPYSAEQLARGVAALLEQKGAGRYHASIQPLFKQL
jgi:hypothetical protein